MVINIELKFISPKLFLKSHEEYKKIKNKKNFYILYV